MQARAANLARQVADQHLLVSAAWGSDKRQVLMEARERSYTVCKNGGYSRGPTRVGTRTNVEIIVRCPLGSKPVAIFHTHPNGNPLPSALDLRTTRQLRVPYVCVKARGKTRCYRSRK